MHEVFLYKKKTQLNDLWGYVFWSRNLKMHNYRSSVKAAIIIVPLLGVTWVVGTFAVNENTVVFAWIFTVLNSLQVCVRVTY